MESLLQVNAIEKTYGKGDTTFKALDDVSFTIEHGEFVGIMGPSGAGKSTLLNVLATIDTPTAGDILIEGENIAKLDEESLSDFRRDHLGFIFQDYNLLDSLTVRENILLPLAVAKTPVHETRDKVDALAKRFGIASILDQYPYEISGGQKQRTAVCRALVADPKLIFADEPTGALDSKSATDLLQTLAGLNEAETTIMMVTHDAYAASFCRRVLYIQDGKLSHELIRGSKSRDVFYQAILDELAKGGATDDVI
ncbi:MULTISPECIES: ABC transporter ATP-binding protein [unclassified Exiguobacterium]|uniref:ABC transporter ATP-binding protein n=1 Tax=unclassified Exiguobacterium TaxID=2644629 RepID=UPI00103C0C8D|nr:MULTISPECIES: ABC transporter ATP-binding protein [unclassified Exiguobacterium]TCI39096.1 ABC transporter ATP-binding protein [Exiguobacterium sp. SH4S7]TCI63117.1 ABC transporter ATP-binding protein [Exiguobacterium sp. SH0S2]